MLEMLMDLFGSARDPVLIVHCGQVVFRNKAALYASDKLLLTEEILDHAVPFVGSVNLDGVNYQVMASAAGEYKVFVLYRLDMDDRTLFASAGNSIKNSVMTIQMAANMLNNSGDDGLSESYMSALYHQIHSINRVAGNMLYLGGADEDISTEQLDLVDLFGSLVHSVNVLTNGSRAVVEFSSSVDSLAFVGNSAYLERMLLNLLSNSLKATPIDGKVTVSVGKLGNRATITVRDNGSGIPDDVLPKLFASYEVERSLSETYQGLGMGLAVVRGIVGSMNGTVMVVSDAVNGTTITISLPIDENSDSVLHSHSSAYGMKSILLLQTELCDVLNSDCYSEKFRD